MDEHLPFMKRALALAKLAGSLGEVPVGAVVVIDNTIVSEAYNRRELDASCLAHAELLALAEASRKLGRWRLTDATIYVTLEPCIMCAGALLHARVKKLIYGVQDPKFGAIKSLYQLAQDKRLNHQFAVVEGILAEESARVLKEFFLAIRNKRLI